VVEWWKAGDPSWWRSTVAKDDGDSLQKFSLMLPRSVYRALREESYLREMPISQIIIEALTRRIMFIDRTSKKEEKP
jgi:hypothetical protein